MFANDLRRRLVTAGLVLCAFALVGCVEIKPSVILGKIRTVEVSFKGAAFHEGTYRTVGAAAGYQQTDVPEYTTPTGEQIREIREATDKNAAFVDYVKSPAGQELIRAQLKDKMETALLGAAETMAATPSFQKVFSVSPDAPDAVLEVEFDQLVVGFPGTKYYNNALSKLGIGIAQAFAVVEANPKVTATMRLKDMETGAVLQTKNWDFSIPRGQPGHGNLDLNWLSRVLIIGMGQG